MFLQELIDQSDAVSEAIASVVEISDLKRLKCDYTRIASSLIEIMNDRKICRPNRDVVSGTHACKSLRLIFQKNFSNVEKCYLREYITCKFLVS